MTFWSQRLPRNSGERTRSGRWIPEWIAVLLLVNALTARADETHVKFLDQLRQRRLFSLAEGEALSRLNGDRLSIADRTFFSIELSKTLTQHAGYVSDHEQEELWQRARTVLEELLKQDGANTRSVLVEAQLATISLSEGIWLRGEITLRPFDEPLLKQAKSATTSAIEGFQSIEKSLVEPNRNPNEKKSRTSGLSGHELRALLHEVRWQLGQCYQNLADLDSSGSAERTRNAITAEQFLRQLTGVADEPVQSRAKILLAACSRLKGDLKRAAEMLNAIEKADSNLMELVADDMIAERVRLLLELKRPDEAVERLMKRRSVTKRLTGELWFLQTQSLIALREITLQKKQTELEERLTEQIGTTLDRCENQVGGYWSRRCRQLWDNVQTAQKYGPQLDSLMQQARMSYTAGRIDAALTQYASAETEAKNSGQADLAMELGFTRASILLNQKQYEAAAAEFLRLATEYATQKRAANAHLLGTFSLGRLYDEKKTQQRREAYTEALDRHLKEFSDDPTVNEARFLKAQLEEQRLQATLALPLYLDVERGHARASDAISGAARCYEVILKRMREQHVPTADLEREAIDRLTKYLSQRGEDTESWTSTNADVALRLVSILLLGAADAANAGDSGRLRALVLPGSSPRWDLANQWLSRVASYIQSQESNADLKETLASLIQRMEPLQFIMMVLKNNDSEAERLLKSIAKTPSVLLSIMIAFDDFSSAQEPAERKRMAEWQSKVAEQLIPLQDQLNPAQRIQFDQALIRSYTTNGQTAKAVEIIQRLSEKVPKDTDQQRQFAQQLAESNDIDALTLAKKCWRRVESLAKPGSDEWMSARVNVLRISIRLKQTDEARKLLQVTKVLYPDPGAPWNAQLQEISKELQSK
jgi:tetratricopeptide (TPR) repeat protein